MSNRSSWFGSPLSSSQSQSGSTMSLNGGKQHGYSSSKPKEPRPQRATMIAGAIGQGIREAILVTEEDISVLKSSLETLSLQSQQVIWHCSLCPYFSLILWLLVDLIFVEKREGNRRRAGHAPDRLFQLNRNPRLEFHVGRLVTTFYFFVSALIIFCFSILKWTRDSRKDVPMTLKR